jgi:hypothetical protein
MNVIRTFVPGNAAGVGRAAIAVTVSVVRIAARARRAWRAWRASQSPGWSATCGRALRSRFGTPQGRGGSVARRRLRRRKLDREADRLARRCRRRARRGCAWGPVRSGLELGTRFRPRRRLVTRWQSRDGVDAALSGIRAGGGPGQASGLAEWAPRARSARIPRNVVVRCTFGGRRWRSARRPSRSERSGTFWSGRPPQVRPTARRRLVTRWHGRRQGGALGGIARGAVWAGAERRHAFRASAE